MPETGEFGTERSHYAGPDSGPFRCGYCDHFAEPHYCLHPKVIEDARAEENGLKMGKRNEGREECAIVSADGCCNYFWPK